MSRRFGRKQRRACAATISALCDAVDDLAKKQEMLDALHRRERHRVEYQRDALLEKIRLWDSEIRGLLGPYTSFAIDDTTYRVDHPDQIRQLPVMPPAPSVLFAGPVALDSLEYYVETMLVFITGIDERDQLRLRRLLTLRVCVGSEPTRESAFYAFSESVWHELKRADHRAQERVAMRVARDMIGLLAKPPAKKAAADADHAH